MAAKKLGLGPGMNFVLAQDLGGEPGEAMLIPLLLEIKPERRVLVIKACADRMLELGSGPPYVWLLCGSRGEVYGRTRPIADWQEFDQLVSEWLSNTQAIGSLT
jgi:hypothetical protein